MEKGYHEIMENMKDPKYKEGYDDGKGHRTSSIPTLKMFNVMNKEITTIKVTLGEHGKDIAYIKQNSDEMKESHKELNKKIDDFIKSAKNCYADKKETEDFIKDAPKKFASKETQRIVFGFIALILTVFAIALINNIIPK